jgi:spore coat polysaccharide biosynthesis protein SpsF
MAERRLGAIIQARTGSVRLPGKVVMPLEGRPALTWLLERLSHAVTLDAIIVATSVSPDDDAVAGLCGELGVSVHRGSEDEVATRLLEAAERFDLDAFVRVNGDSPLIDQALVDRGVRLFRQGGRDLVTNVFPRSYPRGQSVEVLSTASLRAALPRMTEPGDREHVTVALYREPAGLTVENFDAGADGVGPDGGPIRLVLDTPADAGTIERILHAMQRPHWQYSWREVLELASAQTEVR